MSAETDANVRARRSLLFVPAMRPDRFVKAVGTGADIVCVDLEDAVSLDRKDEARRAALELFSQHRDAPVEQMLRINSASTYHGLKDLQALIETPAPPQSILIPKVRSAEEVQLLDTLLSSTSAKNIRFCVLIETNQGLERVYAIANASARIDSMIFGAVDLSADLRCQKSWEPLLYARSRVVHAAASAGIDVMDVPFLNLDDAEGLKHESIASARLGFTGKAAIHPNQIAIINEVFSPTEAQVAKARRAVAAFDADPSGLVVIDNELIELPVIRTMRRVLAIADRIASNKTAR